MIKFEHLKNTSGLYIVTLKNHDPISVNANDKRLAEKCIKVNFQNCKFGKAKCLYRRHKNYLKVFGEENTFYTPIVSLQEIDLAESLILKALDQYRLKGRTGKKNEWLCNLTKDQLIEIIMTSLENSNIPFIDLR